MDRTRAVSRLADPDQWVRCRHEDTVVLPEGGVALTWHDPDDAAGPAPCAPAPPGGLVVDRWCRGYRSRPGLDRVDTVDLRENADTATVPCVPGTWRAPRGLALDGADRLYGVESTGRVRVVDLGTGRVLAVHSFRAPGAPRRRAVDVCGDCCGALVLTRDPVRVVRVAGRRGPGGAAVVRRPRRARGGPPIRLLRLGSDVLLLWPGTAHAPAVVARLDGTRVAAVRGATSMVLLPGGLLAVAGPPDGLVHRFVVGPGGDWPAAEPLEAPGFDGGAIAVAPDGRLVVTTAAGVGATTPARLARARTGRVVGYRLDSGAYRTRWGRVTVRACVPPGTDVRLRFLTSDVDDVLDPVPARPPERGGAAVLWPDATPPLPSQEALDLAGLNPASPLHRVDEAAAGDPVGDPAGPAWRTYEAPVLASAGRYLWLVVELSGTGRTGPAVRSVEVERPGHRLLASLPRAWSRREEEAAFLHRFLMPAEGMLHALDDRAADRDALLDPDRAPADLLDWLAGLLGVGSDARWPEGARRRLLAEAFELYRLRGTVRCLERILELYLGATTPVVELWRLRGLPGTTLGATATSAGDAVLPGRPAPWVGGGILTGTLGRFSVGGEGPGSSGWTAAAHRFTVLVARRLDDEQRRVVRDLVEQHKPAHTLGDVCESSGMRVGRVLRLGLTSVVGGGPPRPPAVVGDADLGATSVGTSSPGSPVGSPVGEVVVG